MKKKIIPSIAAFVAILLSGSLHGVILVQTSDAGYYNNSIGTVLNNTNGGTTPPGFFPTTNDSNVDFAIAPDLSAASGALGNWLTDPGNLNANWNFLANIPNSWTAGTEVAVIYRFDTLAATNVVASFGVDNGIHAWLNGVYLGGARRAGGVSLGEHVFNVGDLSAGNHYLQLLLEDHGSASGYAVEITADAFTQGPPPSPPGPPGVPDSGISALLLCLALAGLKGFSKLMKTSR